MKYIFTILFTIYLLAVVAAQSHENNIIFGFHGGSISPNNDEYGLNLFQFSNGSLEISDNQTSDLFFNDTDAAISDADGNLMFYYNGIDIYNHADQIMENGDTLNPYMDGGYDVPQGGVIIPRPNKVNQYLLFHETELNIPGYDLRGVGLYYSIIDMDQNGGLGKVVQRKQPMIIDTLDYGKIAVVRHANGNDWWLVVGEDPTNAFYIFLIKSKGVFLISKQSIGQPRPPGFGQAFFSPDGKKYIQYNSFGSNFSFVQSVDIYDFDRCSGLLSNQEHIEHPANSTGNGNMVISPNSRWLYMATLDWIYQYDLWANPVVPTQTLIATYEPFDDPFPTKYHFGFLAPDDKIYITTTSGSRTLHVIHNPDEQGAACSFENHGIRLICNNARSLPTFANYRLGPIDGSPCDTSGIDNDPVSWWRYTQDTLNPNHISFHDLSYHEPTIWSWDFGDGNTSTVRHPEYTYALPGVYEVCLTVTNVNGSNTHCKTIYGVTAAENPEVQRQITVAPNPFRSYLGVSLGVLLQSPVFRMYDLAGRAVREEHIGVGINEVRTTDLLPGIFFWQVVSDGRVVKTGKCVKVVE